MIKLRTKKPTTRDLVRTDYNPHAHRKTPLILWIALIALIVLGAVYITRYSAGEQAQQELRTLQAENQKLKESLAQNVLKMQQDQATREELTRQVSELSADIKKQQSELAFFRQRKDKAK